MKRFILSAVLAMLAFAATASATSVQVIATNFNNYGLGAACVVNDGYNGAFEQVFRAGSFNTNNNNVTSAVTLVNFFQDTPNAGTCYKLPVTGVGTIDVPSHDNVYIVVFMLSEGASTAYWKIINIDGSMEQVVTTP